MKCKNGTPPTPAGASEGLHKTAGLLELGSTVYLVPFPSEAWRASTKICNGLMRWILAPRQQLDPFNMESTPRALCQTRRVGLSGCLCTAAHGAPDSRRTRGRAYLVMRQTLPFCMQGSLLLFSMDTHNRRMICAHENTS